MKVFVVVWSLSGNIRVVGVYTDSDTAEEKVKEMQKNNIQGWIKVVESELHIKPIVMEKLDSDMQRILDENLWGLYSR